MNSSHSFIAYLALAIPAVMVLASILIFWIRLSRLKRPMRESQDVLLGAVAKSLQERGELARDLGTLRTIHERLLDALPFGLIWVDHAHKCSAINAFGGKLLGVTEGIVGLEADFVLEPFPWLRRALDMPAGRIDRITEGDRRWELQRIEAPGSLVRFEDVTDREAEERRRQLQDRFAELGEMTAGVAHQLKNGLAVLKTQGQLLDRAGHREAAAAVLGETEELRHLVESFLQWAKPLDPRISLMDLTEVVRHAFEETARRPCAQARHLLWSGLGEAQGDALLLHHALVNLLENALQATPEGGKVEILIETGKIRILDQGPGMGEDTMIRMLRPFESGRPEGTGLGLPLALKWLNAQGADLRFQMRPEGGTEAIIQFEASALA